MGRWHTCPPGNSRRLTLVKVTHWWKASIAIGLKKTNKSNRPENTNNSTTDQDSGSFIYVILISCVATIGGFLFGFDSGVICGTVDGLRPAFNSDAKGTGFNVASMLLG